MRAREIRAQPRTAKPFDRFAIQVVGGCAVAQQRPAARLDAERDVRAAGPGRLGQPLERLTCKFGVSCARGRLDEFWQRQYGHKDLAGARRSLLGGRHGLLVTGEAVVQDRSRPMRVHCNSGSILLNHARDQRGRLGFPPLQGPEPQRGTRHVAAPGCRHHAVDLRDERGGTRQVADPRPCQGQGGQVDGQLREGAGVADELQRSRGDRQHALVVPHGEAGRRGHPAPAKGVLRRDLEKRFRCLLQSRSPGGASLDGQQSKPVEQQVEWTGRSRRRGEGPGGARYLTDDASSYEVAGHDRPGPGDQVGLAREVEVERFETSRGP